jgi:ADP-ribose pyrophosphatase
LTHQREQNGELKNIKTEDRNTRKYPNRPIAAVGVLIQDKDKVLLIKRGTEPGKDLWSIPGGMIELGETAREAGKREVEEEIGLRVKLDHVIDVFDRIFLDNNGVVESHYVIMDFLGHPVGGVVRPTKEAKSYKWIRIDEADSFPTSDDIKRMIRNLYEVKRLKEEY